MKSHEFENGAVLTYPEGRSVVCSMTSENGEGANGIMTGNRADVGALILGAVEEFYKKLNDEDKKSYILACVRVFEDNNLPGDIEIMHKTERREKREKD